MNDLMSCKLLYHPLNQRTPWSIDICCKGSYSTRIPKGLVNTRLVLQNAMKSYTYQVVKFSVMAEDRKSAAGI